MSQIQEFPTDRRRRIREEIIPRQLDAAAAYDNFIQTVKSQLNLWREYQATSPPADELAETGQVFAANAASFLSEERMKELAHAMDIITAGIPNPADPTQTLTRQFVIDYLATVPPFAG